MWALVVSPDNKTIVSGAADSVITFWEDSTETEVAEKESQRTEMIVKYVQLSSHFYTCTEPEQRPRLPELSYLA